MKNKLPPGVLIALSSLTKLPETTLSDYLNDRRNMRKSRAIELERNTLIKGSFFSRENWMFYPEKIKASLIAQHTGREPLNEQQ